MSDPLVLKISADTQDLKKSLETVVSELKKTNSAVQAETKTSKLAFASFIGTVGSAAVTKAFDVLVGGLKSFSSAISESIANAKVEEKAINDLNQSFIKTGIYSKEASEDFRAFASSLQAASTIGDEVIVKNASIIQSLGRLDTEGLKRATQAAADLAAGLDKSFDMTSQLIGKAAAGNIGALSKLGISFEATGDKAKDFDTALRLIEQRFGGSAAAQINTYDGATKQLGNTYSDLQELIGGVVTNNTTLRGSFQGLNVILQAVQEWVKNNTASIQEFISSGIRMLVGAIPVAATGINLLIDTFTVLKASFDGIKYLLNETARGFVNLAQIAVDVVSALANITGVNSEFINSAKASLDSLNEVMAATSQSFIKDAAGTIEANKQKKDAISDFASFAEQSLNDSIARAEAQSQAEIDILKVQQSEMNALRIEAQEAELARQFEELSAQRDQKLAFITEVLGQEEALKVQSDINKLAQQQKYGEALKVLQAADEKAKKEANAREIKLERDKQNAIIGIASEASNFLGALNKNNNKGIFLAQKALAAAQVIIAGEAASAAALAPPPIGAGPIAGAGLAGLIKIKTALGLATIAAQTVTGLNKGGLVEGGNIIGDSTFATLTKGEVVAPRKDFDDVVEGTARQRGFVKRDEVETPSGQTLTVNIMGDIVGSDQFVNDLISKIRDAVQFRNADLGVA